MLNKVRHLPPLADRGPLKIMFLITSMPVGGAETLLVNLIRRLDRNRFLPELCCLKSFGPLGEALADEIPVFHGLLAHKYDLRILLRLTRLLGERRTDAVVTVGAGDKMFWGRLAAWRAGVPVVLSALHSTGWPDGVAPLNRLLTPITDGFIAVAAEHGRHLIQREGFPAHKVFVVPNGVDVERFSQPANIGAVRAGLGLPVSAPLAGIVAALRTEKNHELFLRAASLVRRQVAKAHFLIIGDGPQRSNLESLAKKLDLDGVVHFLGARSDIPSLLAALDVFVLTSRIEANPVSILEAMAAGKPVIAPRVGSIAESVSHGTTGYLTDAGDATQTAERIVELFENPRLAAEFGSAGRAVVRERWSLERMVQGYERLIASIYTAKASPPTKARHADLGELAGQK